MAQEPKAEWETPRVSPYRLAAHLTSAFVIYSGLLWTTLNLFFPVSSAVLAPPAAATGAAALRKMAHPLAALIGITAVSGKKRKDKSASLDIMAAAHSLRDRSLVVYYPGLPLLLESHKSLQI